MDGKYHVLYKMVIKQEGFDKSEFQAVNAELMASTDFGAADALLLVSIMRNAEGEVSYTFPSVDGIKGDKLSVDDSFKVWAALGHALSLNEELGYGRKALCAQVHNILKNAINMSKGN